MKFKTLLFGGLCFLLVSCSTQKETTKADASNKMTDLTTNKDVYVIQDSLSYALGIVQANELMQRGMEVKSMADYNLAFKKTMDGTIESFGDEGAMGYVQKKLEEVIEKQNAMNKQKGEAFLAENGAREEVMTTESGLQYEVLQKGEGPIPTADQKVTTHYTGMLIDGTIFDSSVQRGEPITFPVGGVIQGWQEALQIMPKGSKWKLYIPQELAYGERGAGNVIPPFSTLIFEIELLEIE